MEDVLVTGPGRGAKELLAGDVQTKDTIATFGGLRMIVSGSVAYMQSERQLAAFDRGRYLGLSRPQAELKRKRAAVQKSLDKMQSDQPEAEEARRQLQELSVQIRRLDVQMSACYLWTVPCDHPYSMIAAAGVLFVGGENEVAAVGHRERERGLDGRGRGQSRGSLHRRWGALREHGYGAHPLLPADRVCRTKVVAEEIGPDPYPARRSHAAI